MRDMWSATSFVKYNAKTILYNNTEIPLNKTIGGITILTIDSATMQSLDFCLGQCLIDIYGTRGYITAICRNNDSIVVKTFSTSQSQPEITFRGGLGNRIIHSNSLIIPTPGVWYAIDEYPSNYDCYEHDLIRLELHNVGVMFFSSENPYKSKKFLVKPNNHTIISP